MTSDEIMSLAREIYEAGFWFTPRTDAHTQEWAEQVEGLLNRIYRHFGRACAVTLDEVGVTVRMLPKG